MSSHTNMYKDLHFDTYDAARDVLDSMHDIAKTYGRATAADLMRLVDCQPIFADTKFFWTEPMLRHSEILQGCPDGYTLKFIDPIHELSAPKKVKVTKREYDDAEEETTCGGPKCEPIFITINRDVYEDVDDVLKSLFKNMACLPGREFHITIE